MKDIYDYGAGYMYNQGRFEGWKDGSGKGKFSHFELGVECRQIRFEDQQLTYAIHGHARPRFLTSCSSTR